MWNLKYKTIGNNIGNNMRGERKNRKKKTSRKMFSAKSKRKVSLKEKAKVEGEWKESGRRKNGDERKMWFSSPFLAIKLILFINK